jgi:hypothetical protein
MSTYLSDEAPEHLLDYARRLLDERRVSTRAVRRIIMILEDTPETEHGLPSQTETAKMLKQWTAIDGRPQSHG